MILPVAIESATLFLLVGVLLVSSVLKITRPTSPKLHRYLWGAVLIQGVLFAKWTIGIAWYEAAPETQPSLIKTSHLVEPMELNQVVASQPSPPPSAAHFSEQDEGAEKLAFSSMDLTKALSGIWLFGILVILVRWSASYLLLIRRLRDACPAGGAARHQWREVLKSAGQRSHVPVLFHDQLGPFLVWRPSGYALVLPEPSWIRLSQKHRSTILRHEAAHLSRRDIPASSIARLIALIHWFNPAGWYAVRRFDEAASRPHFLQTGACVVVRHAGQPRSGAVLFCL